MRARQRLGALLGLGLAFPFAAGCLLSTAGLTGGSDGGPATKDGGSDSGPEGAAPDGSVDANASDTAAPSDSSLDSTRRDTGVDSATASDVCIPQAFDGGAPVACTPQGPDASSCGPQPVPTFQVDFIPPRAPMGSCTAAQITGFADDCLGADAAACNTFQNDSTNAACLSCIASPFSTSQKEFGALLQGNGYLLLDVGGCIALVDPCQMPCAVAWEAKQQCELASCGTACPITDNASAMAYLTCTEMADECSCLPEQTAVQDCVTALAGTSVVQCFPIGDFAANATNLATIFCNPP